MRWKQDLTPLEEVPSLDEQTRSKLAEHQITTAEELLGQIEAEPGEVINLLGVDQPYMRELKARLRAAIPDETVAAIESQRGRVYPLGALPPDEQPD